VVSNASLSESGGRIPGSRFASMVLPDPGGPISSRLCPPDAAISIARLMFSWPFTSEKPRSVSLKLFRNSSLVFTLVGSSFTSPLKKSISSLMLSIP